MKLLLTSAGIVPEVKEYFLSLLPKKPEEIRVAFITTAAYGESKNPIWMEKDRQLLYECGINAIEDLDLKDKTQSELKKIIAGKDMIFVNGGNTFYLLHWIKKSGFDKVLPAFLKKGGLYVGVSAGSYVACPTIEAATWKPKDSNRIGLTNLTALNLVPFLLVAHFKEESRTNVETEVKRTKYPIVALTDEQAILVDRKKVKLIGAGDKNFYNRFKEM